MGGLVCKYHKLQCLASSVKVKNLGLTGVSSFLIMLPNLVALQLIVANFFIAGSVLAMLQQAKYVKQMNCLFITHSLEACHKAGKNVLTQNILKVSAALCSWCYVPQHYYHSGQTFCQQDKQKERPIKQALVEAKDKPFAELTLGQKGKKIIPFSGQLQYQGFT